MIKCFLYKFFLIYKHSDWILSKKQQKTKKIFKKKLPKGIKIFLKKKNNKKRQYGPERHKNLSEEQQDEKQMQVEYRQNYYITLKTITAMFLNKVPVFLAISVVENAVVLGQADTFNIKQFEFLYYVMQWNM